MRIHLTFVLASILSLASFAHADLILNPQQIQEKSVSTCLSLYRALDNVSALATNQKITGGQAGDLVDYGGLGDRLLADFNALNCQSILAQEHDRVAQKEANCKKLRANLDRAQSQLEDAALDGLSLVGERAQNTRFSRANANLERALNAMESSSCSRHAK